ncbi:MAG: RNA-directed polymerase [Pseudonocardia sp.]|nr:RNA-directed polymerase [Pseudonocardia sp.]
MGVRAAAGSRLRGNPGAHHLSAPHGVPRAGRHSVPGAARGGREHGSPAPSHHHESLVIDPGRGPARGAARAVAGGVPRRGTGRARRSARGGRADPQARRTLAGAAPRDLRRTRRGAGARPHRAPPNGAGAPGPDVALACAGMERGPRAGGGPGLARGRAGVVRRSRGLAPHGARGAAAPLPATVAGLPERQPAAARVARPAARATLPASPASPASPGAGCCTVSPATPPAGCADVTPRREPAGPRSGPEAHGSAAAVGARYGRYADGLVFSGDRGLPVHGLLRRARDIAADEGFSVRPDKTRIMPAHHRQRVTGLVVNSSPRRRVASTTSCARRCTTAPAPGRTRRTGPDTRRSAITCWAGSRGWRAGARRAGRGCGSCSRRSPGRKSVAGLPRSARCCGGHEALTPPPPATAAPRPAGAHL